MTALDEPIVMRPEAPASKTPSMPRIVNSHNEWDLLEEVIVGDLDDATIPGNHVAVTCNLPPVVAKTVSPVFAARGFRRL